MSACCLLVFSECSLCLPCATLPRLQPLLPPRGLWLDLLVHCWPETGCPESWSQVPGGSEGMLPAKGLHSRVLKGVLCRGLPRATRPAGN